MIVRHKKTVNTERRESIASERGAPLSNVRDPLRGKKFSKSAVAIIKQSFALRVFSLKN